MAKLKIQNSQNLVSCSCFGCFELDVDHHYLINVGQVVGGEVLASGLPLLVRAAFDGETDRLDTILVIHPVYRLRKFEPLVTLADGVEQHGLYAAGNDVRKDDAGFLEKDSRPVDFFREPHRQLRDFQCVRRWNPEHCGSHVPVLRQVFPESVAACENTDAPRR